MAKLILSALVKWISHINPRRSWSISNSTLDTLLLNPASDTAVFGLESYFHHCEKLQETGHNSIIEAQARDKVQNGHL